MNQTSKQLNELKSEFRANAERPDDLFLLRPEDATRMIEKGVALGLQLAGIEAFRLTPEGAFQPEQDFSNDAVDSTLSHVEFVQATLKLIRRSEFRHYLFEVVFER